MEPTIAIIAGHGGIDPDSKEPNTGIVRDGLIESEVTLDLALQLKSSLFGLPINAVLIRTKDEYLSHSDRYLLLSECGANFALSIHINGGPKTFRGADIFHWPKNIIGKQAAIRIARAMPPELFTGRVHQAHDNGQFPRVRYVLGNHPRFCTSVLAECGYATNDENNKFIMTPQGRGDIVSALRAGVMHFWRVYDGTVVN